MTKKIMVLVLFTLFAISLAGCGATESSEDPERLNPTPVDVANTEFTTETIADLGVEVTYPSDWTYSKLSDETTWIAAKYGDTLDGDMGFQVVIAYNEDPVDLELFAKVQASPFAEMDKFEILETGTAEISGLEGRYQTLTWEAVDNSGEPLAQCYAQQYYTWFQGYNYIITIFTSGKETYDANLDLIEYMISKLQLIDITAAE